MVKNCSAYRCHNRINVCKPGVRFHRLPQEPQLRRRWMIACGRPDWRPSKHTYFCSEHFKPSCYWYYSNTPNKAKLLPNAVPSIFNGMPPLLGKLNPVEFKPEMWEENGMKKALETELEGEPPVKRGRGRPRKHPIVEIKPVANDSPVKANGGEVVSCSALACTNTSENFIMNSLPEDPILRKLWVKRIDRLDWSPEPDSALCEVHFDEEMWDHDLGAQKALRPDAVPSLFLHGEGIKSWVTIDNAGNVADVVVGSRNVDNINGNNHDNSEESMDSCEQYEDEDPSMLVKREALEPEIDMVEGSEEDMVPREGDSAGEQFETIYCDSTFNDHEDSEDDTFESKEEDDDSSMATPTSNGEKNPLDDERSSPILQDGEVSCMEDSTKSEGKKLSNYMVISMASKEQKMKDRNIKRRSSHQLTDEFQCPICDRRLSRRKNLEIHIEKLHPFGEMSEHQKKRKEGLLLIQKPEELLKSSQPHPTVFKKPPPPLKPIVPQCLLSPSIPVIPLNTSNTTSAPDVLQTSIPILTFSSQSPLVSSSIQTTTSSMVTPTLVTSQPLMTSQSLIASQPLMTSQPLITSQPLVAPTALIASPNLVGSTTAGTLITSSSVVTAPRPLDPSPAGGEMRKQFLLFLPKQPVIPKPPLSKSPNAPTPPEKSTSDPRYSEEIYSISLSEIPKEKRVRLKDKLRELVDAVVKKNLNPEKIIIAYDRT